MIASRAGRASTATSVSMGGRRRRQAGAAGGGGRRGGGEAADLPVTRPLSPRRQRLSRAVSARWHVQGKVWPALCPFPPWEGHGARAAHWGSFREAHLPPAHPSGPGSRLPVRLPEGLWGPALRAAAGRVRQQPLPRRPLRGPGGRLPLPLPARLLRAALRGRCAPPPCPSPAPRPGNPSHRGDCSGGATPRVSQAQPEAQVLAAQRVGGGGRGPVCGEQPIRSAGRTGALSTQPRLQSTWPWQGGAWGSLMGGPGWGSGCTCHAWVSGSWGASRGSHSPPSDGPGLCRQGSGAAAAGGAGSWPAGVLGPW